MPECSFVYIWIHQQFSMIVFVYGPLLHRLRFNQLIVIGIIGINTHCVETSIEHRHI